MTASPPAAVAASDHPPPPGTPGEEGGSRSPRAGLVWLLVAALAATASAMALPDWFDVASGYGETRLGPWAFLALIPLFALAEVVVIHLPTLRNAHGHTLREIPAVIGLAFLAPQEYVLAYVLGAVPALFLYTRMRGVKLAFNAALFAFEAALGALVFHAVLGESDPVAVQGWLAALAAVVVTDLLSAAAVTAAISATEGVFDGDVLREALRSGFAAACINTCVALLVVILLVERPSALALLGFMSVLLVLGYRVYTALARGHSRTQLLYRFVERTADARSRDDVVRVVLSESAELMHAASAHILDLGTEQEAGTVTCRTLVPGGEVVTTTSAVDPEDPPWWFATTNGASLLLPAGHGDAPDQEQSNGTGIVDRVPRRPRDAVAAPLRTATGVRGVLVVCDRTFDKETFGNEDALVFETLASHAAIAVERADSVDRLERLAVQRAHDALHDPLSGLPNRRAFNEAVSAAMSGGAEGPGSSRGVVLLLDLDDFKDVNDTLGHSAGDRLIVVSGERLRQRARGLVARLGGDEFAVLLPGMHLDEGLAHAHELHAALSVPVPLEDVDLIVSSSIGVAELDASATTAEELIAQADVAMYTAKADRSAVAVYRAEAGSSTARRLTLAADLPAALEAEDIRLWFQPQAEASTGAVVGFEALMRWNHPVFGWVPPPEVVAVAQRTGRVRSLTDDLIRQALAAREQWRESGHDLSVAVNITPADIADPLFVGRVEQALAASGTPAEALVLEVTESDAMKDPERSLEVLTALSRRGLTLSVDDFGTGYSSLAYLDRLPVKEVKIDQSFVRRIEQGVADATIIAATVGLAHDLGLRVVAEGVESDLAHTLVRDLHVDLYQGYGLARPMAASDVGPWLDRRAGRAHAPAAGRDRALP